MMLTEEEALTKWCPFVRAGNTVGNCSGPRRAEESIATCIASQCMAWRSVGAKFEYKSSVESPGAEWEPMDKYEAAFIGTGKIMGWRRMIDSAARGFCGLAGKP